MDDSRRQSATSSRLGMRHAAGEIVEVQGGHIVRSTGRKDRHSKVCTAKGPRDRRVRLSAHTAIQFYDVQDRLGYDRPSKAVDWLIKKAKPAIDELAELPPWNPQTVLATAKSSKQAKTSASKDGESAADGSRVRRRAVDVMDESEVHRNLLQQEMGDAQNNNSGYLPTSLGSDTIDDTIKSFFPIVAVTEAQPPATAIQFQSYPPDLLSRTSSQNQDLRLSLQSFQESAIMLHHQAAPSAQAGHGSEPVLFSGTLVALGGFDVASAGWEHHPQPAEMSRFQRMMSWNGGGADTGNGGSGGGGFVFGSPAQPQLQPVFGGHNSQLFSQRGPLQSSNTPSVRAWIDQSISATEEHHQVPQGIYHPQSGTSGIGFTSSGGFPRFRMPARIQGDEEEHDGIHSKPSSASFDSRH